MSQSNFDVIFKQAYDLAERLTEKDFDDEFLKQYKTYSAFIGQIIQILNSIDVKDDELNSQIKNLLALHKKVEYRLIQAKDEIRDSITNKIRKEHIRQKYHSKSLRTALLNKKA